MKKRSAAGFWQKLNKSTSQLWLVSILVNLLIIHWSIHSNTLSANGRLIHRCDKVRNRQISIVKNRCERVHATRWFKTSPVSEILIMVSPHTPAVAIICINFQTCPTERWTSMARWPKKDPFAMHTSYIENRWVKPPFITIRRSLNSNISVHQLLVEMSSLCTSLPG